jgi:CelD/BcsL family acetyltransferase involved in cellulose biosynthesis
MVNETNLEISIQENRPSGTHTFHVIRTIEDWDQLSGAWDKLMESTAPNVFQSYYFLRKWWQYFGNDNSLYIVVIYRDEELVGIAPMQIVKTAKMKVQLRKLCFLGHRHLVYRPAFMLPKNDQSCLSELMAFLVSQPPEWDYAIFCEQELGSLPKGFLDSTSTDRRLLTRIVPDATVPYLNIKGTWEEFLTSKSRNHRKDLKRITNKIRKLPDIEVCFYDKYPQLETGLEEYLLVERRSWKKDLEKFAGAIIGSGDRLEFFKEIARHFGQSSQFFIWIIKTGGRPIAGSCGIMLGGVYYALYIAYDEKYQEYSPGRYADMLEIQHCFNSGYDRFEFMGGVIEPKLRWTDTYREPEALILIRMRPLPLMSYIGNFVLKPLIRKSNLRLRSTGFLSGLFPLPKDEKGLHSISELRQHRRQPGIANLGSK